MTDFGGEEFQQTHRAVSPTNNTPAGQFTPGPADWTTFQSKPLAGSITAHDPDSIGWIGSWPTWDGTIYDPSTMSRADFTAAICPGGDTIRGIREVFYQHNPFADNANPTKAEVDEWHRIAINHVRTLAGYTRPARQVEKDHCMFARALWGQQRKFTTMWDAKYPDGHCQGTTNPHCGATFIPTDPADQAPYLPPGHAPCPLRPGSEGVTSAPKSNIPWSIKWSRAFCHYLGSEGFWGGHVGPFFHREKFGFSFWDSNPSNNNNNATLRGKWTGTGMPNLYCNPSSSSCSPSAGCGTLVANQSLSIGDTLNSCDGRFRLVMQGDGNLVIYENGHGPVWASGTVGQNGSHVIMQGDGDLVMYTSNGQAVWSSGTHNGPGAHLELKNDGGLVVIRDDVPLWSTGCGAMVAGQTLNIGENLDSCDGRFRLVMQGDGNLVLYETGQGPLWASHTVGQNGNRVALQGDGNLVMYTSSGQAVWSSGTHGHPGAYLALQDDGDLVIYDHLPVWNTGTHDL